MKVLSNRWSLVAAMLAIVAVVAVVGSQAGADTKPVPKSAKGLGPLTGLLPRDHLTEESAIQVDLSKETVRLPLVQGQGERRDGLVRAARLLRRRPRARPGRQLRAQARQHRNRLPRVRAAGDARVADTGREPVRPGGRRLPGRTGLQPDPDRRAWAGRLPARQPPARRGRRAGLQPVHPDRRLGRRLQRADRRHRRRPVRRRPPHQHRRPGARRPHRPRLAARPVPGIVGRHALRQGLRRRPADRLHLAPTPASR